jgi:molecular chaperone HscB
MHEPATDPNLPPAGTPAELARIAGIAGRGDPFALFGLQPAYALDAAALDARFRQLQSQVHPDRYARADAALQRLAMQASVRVNEAYQTLKAPLARAASLCELRGVPVEAQRHLPMPRDFLERQLAWREALAEMQGDEAALERLAAEVRAERRALHDALAAAFEAGDAASLRRAAELVRALMFVEKFDADLAQAFDAV